jgi:hypothetical protein
VSGQGCLPTALACTWLPALTGPLAVPCRAGAADAAEKQKPKQEKKGKQAKGAAAERTSSDEDIRKLRIQKVGWPCPCPCHGPSPIWCAAPLQW